MAKGELNLIIWAGYAEEGANYPEFDWVTPFEEETGCQVNTHGRPTRHKGSTLLRSGEYDGVSFSGDATDRLMAGGDVQPVNVDLIPNYDNVFDGLKNQPHNSVDGVPYGVPHGRGAERADVQHRGGPEAPDHAGTASGKTRPTTRAR